MHHLHSNMPRMQVTIVALLFCLLACNAQSPTGPPTLTQTLTPVYFPVINDVGNALFAPEVFVWQTPVQSHYLLIIATVGRETYAACDAVALSFFGVKDRPAQSLCTPENRAIMNVLNYYYTISNVFPEQARLIRQFLIKVGVDITRNTNLNTPQGYANKLAKRMSKYFLNDGWNLLGNAKGEKLFPVPYEDTTNYQPRNPAHLTPQQLRFPLRWQPLTQQVANSPGDIFHQIHVTPHIGRTVKPKTMSVEQWNKIKTKSPYNTPNSKGRLGKRDRFLLRKRYIPNMLREMRTLATDKNRLFRSYWWNNKLFSLGIFGVYNEFLLGLSVDNSFFSAFGENLAFNEAVLLAWREKRKHDLMRPGPLVRRLFRYQNISSWRGLNRPAGSMHGNEWSSVVTTMPHSEFPSASALLCHAVTGFIKKQIQYKLKSNNVTFPPFQITFPDQSFPSIPVSGPVTTKFSSLEQAADDCGQSRVWAGLHFQPSVDTGKRLGEIIAESTFQTYKDFQEGRVPRHCHWCIKQNA